MAGGLLGRLGGKGHTAEKTFAVSLSDEEWRKKLSAPQFRVLREHGTERAGSSPLDKEYGAGVYRCAGCGEPLFSSDAKFNSGTGWPSFFEPLADAVETSTDRSLFMVRNEVHCRRCGGHLGHVFDDGPQPTGQRYCMNGVSLAFAPGEAATGDGLASAPASGSGAGSKSEPDLR